MTTADPGPDGLSAELRDAVARVAHTPHLLVAMDFDGTMAPLVSRAEDARPLPGAAAAFASLAELESTTTALVSGRALASLRAVASPPVQTLLVGSHGAEVWLGQDSPGLELTEQQKRVLGKAQSVINEAVAQHPGTTVENKPAGVVLHYRQATPEAGQSAVAQVRKALEQETGLFISDGKMVLEISAVNANKGQSLQLLRKATGATAVIFAGDDVTDEHAFAALNPGDVGIKVGQGATKAPFRIGSPEDLPALLELLLATRKHS
ncbi:trehalose-phosphatase [Arthrobacter sp. GMC3]|uniref:trehalose-phosphatase n=1 Tax=Arthrobacter sp. GMC3 TaxID=2058894 RepID=UPI00215730AC|nr:trehalose-phosphatase [Arthrobacter sp. GMC3]